MPSFNRFRQNINFDKTILFLFILPILAYTFFTKYAVVSSTQSNSISVLDWVEFFRVHFSYYALIFIGSSILLLKNSKPITSRIVTAIIFVFFVAIDIGYSTTIYITGTLAPLEVAYYMSLGAGNTSLTLNQFLFITLFLFPGLFFLSLFIRIFFSYHSKEIAKNGSLKRQITFGTVVLTLACIPPQSDIEKNKAIPSLIYLISSHLKTNDISEHQNVLSAKPEIDATVIGNQVTEKLSNTQQQRYNIAIIVLESVGSYALGTYNPQMKKVSPNIDRLFSSGLVARNAYTVMPHTSKALVGINCGQYPFFRHPIFESSMGLPHPCLAGLLQTAGYATAFFQSPTEHFENRRELTQHLGFQTFYSAESLPSQGYELANYFGYEDNIMLDANKEWLSQQEKPFFAFYLTGTTHHPYWVPSRYTYQQFVPPSDNPDLNNYLNAVHYLDHFVKNLVDQYKEAGLYDNTLFVIVGDHGESIGLHGRYQHNASLYQETMQVPLGFHNPKLLGAHKSIQRAVSQIDIAPTILTLLGISDYSGFSGFPIHQQPFSTPHVFSACWYDNWCTAHADAKYKYIYNFTEKAEELYDLKNDPLELINIAESHPEVTKTRREMTIKHYRDNIKRYDSFFKGFNAHYSTQLAKTVSKEAKLFSRP